MTPDLGTLYAAIDGTWPPAAHHQHGGWTLRDGAGGGKRVSAATRNNTDADIAEAEAAMRAFGRDPLFMIRAGEADLDGGLAQRGYARVDPVHLYTCPVSHLTDRPIPKVTAFSIWEPLAIMEEIWAQGGIGPARVAVMHRAARKTGILGRWNDKPAGVAFAAIHADICMVHAVEVLPAQRGQGVASWMMRKAAFWAEAQGAAHLAVLCVEENVAANGLYNALGLQIAGQYHYRQDRESQT